MLGASLYLEVSQRKQPSINRIDFVDALLLD